MRDAPSFLLCLALFSTAGCRASSESSSELYGAGVGGASGAGGLASPTSGAGGALETGFGGAVNAGQEAVGGTVPGAGAPAAGGHTSGSSGRAPTGGESGSSGRAPTGGGGGSSGRAPTDGGSAPGGGPSSGTGGSAGSAGGGAESCQMGVWDGKARSPLTLSGATFAHDPTLLEEDGTYYRFWTGDFVPVATSTDLTRWTSATPVYGKAYPSWVSSWLAGVPGQTFNFPWAPDISRFGGRTHLYASFSARFGDNISCIAHSTTSSVASGEWTDHGSILCTEGDEPYNAIDPDVGFDTQGNPFLAFGSFWDGIFAFPLTPEGERKGTTLTRLAWAREIEAPVLFERCGYYYLFVTWGLCCPGEGRSVSDLTYRVVVGRSRDILGPYVDRQGTPMLNGGGTLVVAGDGTWAAAGHSDILTQGARIYHAYHAYRKTDGGAAFRIVELPFDDEGWPVPHAP